MRRYGRVFQAGTQRRNVANFRFAVELARSGKLGKLTTLHASSTARRPATTGCRPSPSRPGTRSTGTCGSARPRGGRTTSNTSTAAGAATTISIRRRHARLGRPHRRPLPVGQPGRRHDARRVTSRPDRTIAWPYANGVKLVMRDGTAGCGWGRARAVRGRRRLGRDRRQRPNCRSPNRGAAPARAADRSTEAAAASAGQPRARTSSTASSRAHAGRPNADVMPAVAHRLPRRLHRLAAGPHAALRSGQGGVHRRRRGQPDAIRAIREPWRI